MLRYEDNVDYNDPAEYGIVPIRGGSRARAASLARSSPNSMDGEGDTRGGDRLGGAAAPPGVAGFSSRPGSGGRSAAAAGRGNGRGGNGGGRAGGRGGRIGRGLSEAAAALLDMGFVDDDGEVSRSMHRCSVYLRLTPWLCN